MHTAKVLVGGGLSTIHWALTQYYKYQVWSPKAPIYIDGQVDDIDWTLRPAQGEGFNGLVAFRCTAEGGRLVVIVPTPRGYYHCCPGIADLTNPELMLLRMNGARVARPAYAAMGGLASRPHVA